MKTLARQNRAKINIYALAPQYYPNAHRPWRTNWTSPKVVADLGSSRHTTEHGLDMLTHVTSWDEWMWITDLAARQAEAAGFLGTADAFRGLSSAEFEKNAHAGDRETEQTTYAENQEPMELMEKMRANDD
ncbi:hypothetical protein KTN05_13475 [Paracoccus sp. Z118]|uniref:hypothetical protein n=1 Tax=Paracoccus sp. Z118 TaxID=2851017 RepID=UPI001C2C145A|nr:hypothetical protein [Paracoccus sp. Z118]MBV0892852.1 hypothetical protein [Paracoccus sp. Z118]